MADLFISEAYLSILEFFSGDKEKTTLWFNTENPLLGNIKPNDLIVMGREEKLLKFIQHALSENKR